MDRLVEELPCSSACVAATEELHPSPARLAAAEELPRRAWRRRKSSTRRAWRWRLSSSRHVAGGSGARTRRRRVSPWRAASADGGGAHPTVDLSWCSCKTMATSKKDPLNTSRGRMSPNLRPSSSESSGYGFGARRSRSVPSSPDRKFGTSAAVAASGSPDVQVQRPSLSSAGRSKTMGSSIHGSRAQPFPGASSKPTLLRAKSDKVSTSSQRPPALAVPPSNSFKDTAKTAAKASPSNLLRSKPSPRPFADSCKAVASPKPSSQRVASPSTARGDRVQPVSAARSPGAIAKKRLDAVNGATASSKAKSVSQKAMGPSASRKEKDKDQSMQFKETQIINTRSIEEHLHDELPDPVDLKSMDVTVPDQHELSSNQPEKVKDAEESKGHHSEERVDAVTNETHNEGQDANGSIKTIYECGHVEKTAAGQSADKAVPRTEVAQAWRKDDPKGNDVIEETKSKLLEERKSRVKALVGAFETVLSFKE